MALTDYLTNIANAIRTKTGTSDTINAQDFASEILKISGGNSDFTCSGKKKCFVILGQSNAVGATWGDDIDSGILNESESLDNVHYSFNDCGGSFGDYCRYTMNGYLTHGYDTYLWKYIADTLQEDIYVIKYAIGATALTCEALGNNNLLWSVDNETINQKSIARHSYIRKLAYEAIGAIRQCIKNYGSEFEIVAILWNQGDGESSYAEYYGEELKNLVNELRSELNLDVPFITQFVGGTSSSIGNWISGYKMCETELNKFYWKDMRKSNLGMLSDASHYTNELCKWLAKVTFQRLKMCGIIPCITSNETRTILIDGKEININEISTKRYCLIINDSVTKPKYHIFFSDEPIYANVKVQDVSIKLNMKTYQYCYTTDDFETFTIGSEVEQAEYTQLGTIYAIEDLAYSTDNFYYTGGTTEVVSLSKINHEVLPLFTEYNTGIIDKSCTAIALNNTSLSITDNKAVTLTATVTPSNTTDSIIWVSSNEAIATVSSNGVVTPVGTGECTITVTCGEHSATCLVVVEMQEVVEVACTSVTLDKTELSITSESSQTLEATVLPSDTTDTVTWTSDNESVATVVNGTVTPVANGTCNITVICGEHSATCSVTVELTEAENTGILALDSDVVSGTSATINLNQDVEKLSTINYSFDYEIYAKKKTTATPVTVTLRNYLSNIDTYSRKVYDDEGNVASETTELGTSGYYIKDTIDSDDWYTEKGHIEGTIYVVTACTSGTRAIVLSASLGASGTYLKISNINFTVA